MSMLIFKVFVAAIVTLIIGDGFLFAIGAHGEGPLVQQDSTVNSSAASEGSDTTEKSLYGGRDFDTWVHLLNVDLDGTTRWQAIQAIGILGRHGREDDALKVLTPILQSKDRALAFPSHHALAQLGDRGVSILVEALRDPAYPYHESIIQALGKAGPQASSSVDVLLEIAGGSNILLRRAAFEALLAIGNPSDKIAAAIEKEVERNDDSHATATIVFGLRGSPMQYNTRERLLIKWLKSDDRSVVHNAASVLSIVGKNNDSAKGALRSTIRDFARDPKNSGACPNVAATDVNVDLLLPLLIEIAEEQDLTNPTVRGGAFISSFVDNVGGLGRRGQTAVPTLIKVFTSRNGSKFAQVDYDVIQSFWEMGAARKLPCRCWKRPDKNYRS